MGLSLRTIKEECRPESYTRGNTLFRRNAVQNYSRTESKNGAAVTVAAEVTGSTGNIYNTELILNENSGIIREYYCSCPAYYSYDGLCKHCVALALFYINVENTGSSTSAAKEMPAFFGSGRAEDENRRKQYAKPAPVKPKSSPEIGAMIASYAKKSASRYRQPELNGTIELVPSLWETYQGWSLSYKVGNSVKYVIKDLRSFLAAIDRAEMVEYGKKLAFIHDESVFTEEARTHLKLIRSILEDKSFFEKRNYYFADTRPIRELQLSNKQLMRYFEVMAGREPDPKSDRAAKCLRVITGNPSVKSELERKADGSFSFILPPLQCITDTETLAVKIGNEVYLCEEEYAADMAHILEYAKKDRNTELTLREDDIGAFVSAVYPALQKHGAIETRVDLDEYLPEEAVIRFYLDREEETVKCLCQAEYGENGERKFPLTKPYRPQEAWRDFPAETGALAVMDAYFNDCGSEGEFILTEQEESGLYHLLDTGIAQMSEVGEVFMTDAFRRLKVVRGVKAAVGVSLSGGLLELSVRADDIPYEELSAILASYRLKRNYHRLKNGDFISLGDNALSVVAELAQGLNLSETELNGTVLIPPYRAFYIDQVLREGGDGIEVVREKNYRAILREMKSVEDSDYPIPSGLNGTLREYQKNGYRWLRTLDSLSFGGILADDMGLGKTIQMLAYLMAKKEEGYEGTSLIVCPASLVYNWQNEISRFTPGLSARLAVGTAAERREIIADYQNCDVLITSYDLLKRDLDEYAGCGFTCEILDEAQNIKNYTTQTARAVKEIHAEVRFALTGTPIENHLGELWSIFDYLMGGFLGSYVSFRREYELPIVQNQDGAATARLKKMIKPFILRRVKQEVLKELPEKVVTLVYSKFSGEQERLYQAAAKKLAMDLAGTAPDKFASGKIKLLAKLTGLRQLCCDPSLIYEDYRGESAKLETCMELIQNAAGGGSNILVFSQFTSMLAIIEARLMKAGIRSFKLTGSTPKEMRASLVKEFQEGRVPVFLISLKAGGTGLNLTAANIVIHYDPWWNLAAENQATDRTHRIGQQNPVTVFKLIAKDTIEEKIVRMQEDKKNLSDQVISEGGITAAKLTKEDFMALLD